jgi:tRNA pseudouridine13 synthase
MHIKQKPEDFRVEEIPALQPGKEGDYAFYRLEKRNWTTPDAMQIIQRRWKLDRRRIAVGGLKDRHAETIQYLTIYRGPQRKLTHAHLQLTYLGQTASAYESEHILANRFVITVRALNSDQASAALQTVQDIRDVGVPNYFDDQRFGSVTQGGPFLAHQLLLGEYEAALRSALTAPYAFERAPQKKEKGVLRVHWGNWPHCEEELRQLPRTGSQTDALRVIEYLVAHPEDFVGALERLRPEMRTLYLSAHQSYLWNRMLAEFLFDRFQPEELTSIATQLGDLPVPHHLTEAEREQVRDLHLPLHSARIHLEESDPRKPYFDRVLAEEGLTQEQFKLKDFRNLFFSKGERAAWCWPRDLTSRAAGDEEHPGRRKLTLSFELPRGCYATLLVKRITRVDAG